MSEYVVRYMGEPIDAANTAAEAEEIRTAIIRTTRAGRNHWFLDADELDPSDLTITEHQE